MSLTVNSSFQKALEITLKFEGGYSNHSADPGGATNHGVTQVTYNEYRDLAGKSRKNVRLITQSEIKDLYYNLFWRRASCELLPEQLAILHFDTAVNFGCTGANQQLQEAVGAIQDGILGKRTLSLIFQKAARDIIENYLHIREKKYRSDRNFSTFGEGWLNRISSLRGKLLLLGCNTPEIQPAKVTTKALHVHTATWLKTSYAQAATLPTTDKCWLTKGTRLSIESSQSEYGHYRVRLLEPILGKLNWYCYADFCNIEGFDGNGNGSNGVAAIPLITLPTTKATNLIGYDQINGDLAVKIQKDLIRLKLLDPPADGKFGPISTQALEEFQSLCVNTEKGYVGQDTLDKLASVTSLPIPELILTNDLASKIIRYMLKQNYYVSIGERRYNIIYVEGMNNDGTLNSDVPNSFNDRRMVIQVLEGVPTIIGNWEATTEPGKHYTYKPMNKKGAARIKFGQYKAWRVGKHGRSKPHQALVQTGLVTVHRDFNKDFKRTGDSLDSGYFGINQHNGYDLPVNNIYYASAGCLVGRTVKGHNEFMRLVCKDKRYLTNRMYQFYATIIPGVDL